MSSTLEHGETRAGWASRAFDAAKDPVGAVGLLALVQAFVWTVLPALVSTSPPLDVVEGLLWGQEWQLGYHKHPPLPPILANIFRDLTGSPIWGPYLLSQICVGLTFFFVFQTGRLVTNARNALVGTALLTGVYYFTWPTPEFNHNVAQLPIWAAAIYLFALIRNEPERGSRWTSLGLVCGLGIYAKYSVVVLYLSIVGWTLAERRVRASLGTIWPWLGGVLSLLVAGPHVVWLFENGFLPLQYASARGNDADSTVGPAGFLLAQLVNHAPLLLLLAVIGPIAIRKLPPASHPRSDVAFVAAMVFGPLLVTLLASAAVGIDLRDMWGMPMFTMSGLLLVMMLDRDWSVRLTNRAFYTAVSVTAIVAIGYAVSVPVRLQHDDRPRVGWPMKRIARLATDAWQRGTNGAKLEIVSGPMWLAGLISAGAPSRPHVVYDGDLSISPWITPAMMNRDGTLFVWRGGDDLPSFAKGRTISTRGSFLIRGGGDDLKINYAISPPKA